MSYNKEYYEKHKEQMKKSRDKYRKGSPEAIERTRKRNRDRYNNLPPEKKQLLLAKQKEKRENALETTRITYRINAKRKQIRQYNKTIQNLKDNMFMLKMKDTWDSDDFRYSDVLFEQIKKNERKIEEKTKEIEELIKEKEQLL